MHFTKKTTKWANNKRFKFFLIAIGFAQITPLIVTIVFQSTGEGNDWCVCSYLLHTQPSIIRSINNYWVHCSAHWFQRQSNNGKGKIVINVAYQLLAGCGGCYYMQNGLLFRAPHTHQLSKIIDAGVAWYSRIFR